MPSTASTDQPLLQMLQIEKSFPGVHALCGVDLTIGRGEVLALLGENGAGKSTLIKILGGAQRPDAGKILIEGTEVAIASPADAISAGIGVIYQDFNLVPALSASENIFLGREQTRVGLIHREQERTRTRELFQRIGVDVPIDVPCGELSIAQQQLVEIGKTLAQDARLIVMDEPTATLTPREVETLFTIIRELKELGIGVIYISHRLDEIFEIADRVMFLRDGEYIGQAPIKSLTRAKMIESMVGRRLEEEFPARTNSIGESRLVVRSLNRGSAVREVSFEVGRGEVVGLTGLVGAGRTELARLIFGADARDSGTIELDGKQLRIDGPRNAIGEGICLLTEDRKSQGLVLGLNVRENFSLPNLSEMNSAGFIDRGSESEAFGRYVRSLSISISHQEQLACNLSGGNQQKIVLAKWLERNAEVIIFDEPTRGIDVGAKYEIYLLIKELANQGKAILMISSELPEVLGMSDRVLVMHDGRITGEIKDAAQATQEQIMQLAIG